MDFTAIDLGASSTRYVGNNGKIEILPNNMVFLSPNTKVDQEPYSQDIECALDVTIECDNNSPHFPVRVLIGQMAERYSAINERPSGLKNKSEQQISYVSAVMAVALCKYKNNMGEKMQTYLALPPMEVRTDKDLVRENLMGNYTITFHKYKNMEIKVSIEDVGIWEESFMALLAYFFEMNGSMKEQAKKYVKGNVLSLDIGASTTDLAIVKDMKYLEMSGQTYKTGGNIARDVLMDFLRDEHSSDIPTSEAETVMAEGRTQMGAKFKDCSEYVDKAKRKLAEQIVSEIQTYFRKVNVPIHTIKAIIVSGGGSMQGQYINEDGEPVTTSKPISFFITEAIQKICEGVMVEPFTANPRLANISGLYIRANIDIGKKMKELEEAAKAQTGEK